DDLADLEADLDDDLEEEADEPEPLPQPSGSRRAQPERIGYRPGRGGFDPEAAEIAARAKYSFRQRVVVILLVAAVVTAAVADLDDEDPAFHELDEPGEGPYRRAVGE